LLYIDVRENTRTTICEMISKHIVFSLWYFGVLQLEVLGGKLNPVYMYR